jgi:nicotinamide mononucleotide transporter
MSKSALKQSHQWWHYLYPIRNWNLFEQLLFAANFILSSAFFTYNFTNLISLNPNHQIAITINVISYIAGIANITSIILGSKKNSKTFYWGCFAAIVLGVTAYLNHITGTWILYWVIHAPLEMLGLFLWKRHLDDKSVVKIRKFNLFAFMWVTLLLIALITGWAFLDNYQPFHDIWYGHPDNGNNSNWGSYISDACVLVFGVSAMVLMVLRYREQWILWFVLDVSCIVLWSVHLNVVMLISSIASLIASIYGIVSWWTHSSKK